MSEKTGSTPIVADKGHPMSWALPDGATSRFGHGSMMAMAVSPDGAYLAAATKIGLWWYDLATMQPVALWGTERGMLCAVAISPDGRLAATGDWDGVIKVWDIQRSVCLTKIVRPVEEKNKNTSSIIRSLAFSPDNQYLAATGERDERVYTWAPRTGTPLATFHDPQRETRNPNPSPYLIRPVAFSPDSRLLACTASARTTDGPDVVLVWDVVSGECIAYLTEQPSFVYSLSFSPCGHALAIGGYKGTVQVWNVKTWEQQRVYQNYDGTSHMSVCYSQEGVLHTLENTLEKNTVVVWDVERHEKRYTYVEKESEIEEALFSSSSHFVVAGAKEWAVWSPGDTNPRKLPYLHVGVPNSVAFSQDGKKLAVGGYGSTLFWDIANPMQPPTFFKISDAPQAVSVSTSEKIHSTAFVYDENTVKITVKIGEADENTTPMTFTLPDPEAMVTAAAHAPLRHLIACADSKGRLYLWNMRSGDITHTLLLEGDWDDAHINRLIFSEDGKHLVSVPNSSGTMANLWDIDTGKENPEFRVNRVDTVAFSPCGHKIACGMATEIRLWDVNNCRTLLTLPHAPTNGNPRALAFSPCGQYLASGAWWNRGVETEKVPIRLWEVATGENIATFWGHPTDVQDLAFSPDGTLLASGSFDCTILLWDLKSVMGS